MKVLLTGASGFIGTEILTKIVHSDFKTVVINRKLQQYKENIEQIEIASIDGFTDYGSILNGIDTIIHCVGRAHIINERANNPLKKYRSVNTLGTLNLAKQAANSGIKRFIFIS